MMFNDFGVRCEKHFKDPVTVHCRACQVLADEYRQLGMTTNAPA